MYICLYLRPLAFHRWRPLPCALSVKGVRNHLAIHPNHMFQGPAIAIEVSLSDGLWSFETGHDNTFFEISTDILSISGLRHFLTLLSSEKISFWSKTDTPVVNAGHGQRYRKEKIRHCGLIMPYLAKTGFLFSRKAKTPSLEASMQAMSPEP